MPVSAIRPGRVSDRLVIAGMPGGYMAMYFGTQPDLPVRSTHIAVGAVFGAGLLREYNKTSCAGRVVEIEHHHQRVGSCRGQGLPLARATG